MSYYTTLWGIQKQYQKKAEESWDGLGKSSLLCCTHACGSHGCYCWWQTSLTGSYWEELSRSSAHPQFAEALPMRRMLGGGSSVVGREGCHKCKAGWPKAFHWHPPTLLSLPSSFVNSYCVFADALTSLWHWHLSHFVTTLSTDTSVWLWWGEPRALSTTSKMYTKPL